MLFSLRCLGHGIRPGPLDDPLILSIGSAGWKNAGAGAFGVAVQRGTAMLTTETAARAKENFDIVRFHDQAFEQINQITTRQQFDDVRYRKPGSIPKVASRWHWWGIHNWESFMRIVLFGATGMLASSSRRIEPSTQDECGSVEPGATFRLHRHSESIASLYEQLGRRRRHCQYRGRCAFRPLEEFTPDTLTSDSQQIDGQVNLVMLGLTAIRPGILYLTSGRV